MEIRSHHLPELLGYHAQRTAVDASELRRLQARYASTTQAMRIDAAEILASPQYATPNQLFEASCVQDRAGTTFESASRHAQLVLGIFEEFSTLPDETSVVISPEKDRICRETCAIGAHCDALEPAYDRTFANDFVGASAQHVTAVEQSGDIVLATLGEVRSIGAHGIDWTLRR